MGVSCEFVLWVCFVSFLCECAVENLFVDLSLNLLCGFVLRDCFVSLFL